MKRSIKPINGEPVAKKQRLTASKAKNDETEERTSNASGSKTKVGGRCNLWEPADVLSAELGVSPDVSRSVIRLLDEGNSIPFLARYRREATGGMLPDALRVFKESYESLRAVQEKCGKLLAALEKSGKSTPAARQALAAAHSLSELDHAYAPYKTGSKASLAERARQLGLEPTAVDILDGLSAVWDLGSLVDSGVTGKSNMSEIEAGLQHIIADMIVHDKSTCDLLRDLQARARIELQAKRTTAPRSEDKSKIKKPPLGKAASAGKKGGADDDVEKFQNYFSFSCPVALVKPHQVLAINRGESLKILSVKVNLPDGWLLSQLELHLRARWLSRGVFSQFRQKILTEALKDAYKRLISPLMMRGVRSRLTRTAEEAAIQSFAENLRNLLLTKPFRGTRVLSIDPGFTHGCKLAAVSERGDVLETATIYPRFRDFNADLSAVKKLASLIADHKIHHIALGNGTACRETQGFLGEVISRGLLEASYCIVEERGASIYSCSPLAAQEFPTLDTNIISAVSIARRLQDPLSEYVKIEPQHLGVGMYQHDISQKKLHAALDEIVTECVSFVGVDLNTCSEHLLRRVAGLTPARAKAVAEYRQQHGDFKTRDDLKKVKGIGDKVFVQCSGFVRIRSSGASAGTGKQTAAANPLDATSIHPESYTAASRLIKHAGCVLADLGSANFLQKMSTFLAMCRVEELAETLGVGVPTLQLMLDALSKPLEHDLRDEFAAPLFRCGLTRLEDVDAGSKLTGRVSNVTDFGAFVDVGLGRDGLIHVSKMHGQRVELGQRLEVKLISKAAGKISLELISII